MGFYIRKSFGKGPLKVNLSKSGLGLSFGVKGLRYGINSKGKEYVHAGRYGLYYKKVFNDTNTENNSYKDADDIIKDELIPGFLKLSPSKKVRKVLFVLMLPIELFLVVFGIATLFTDPNMIFLSVIFLGFAYIAPYSMFYSKDVKMKEYFEQGIKEIQDCNFYSAINYFEKSLASAPRDTQTPVLEFIKGVIYEAYITAEDYDQAIEVAKKFSISGYREKIVYCYYNQKKWNEIVKFIQREYSSNERKNNPIIIAMLAEAFLYSGQKEIALESILQGPTRRRVTDKQMCAFVYTLGKCYEANGDKEGALKQYQKVYAFDMEYEDVAEKIKMG